MNVYDIRTRGKDAPKYCVVAKNIADAEDLFLGEYGHAIKSIKVHSDCALVQGLENKDPDSDSSYAMGA